MVIRDIENDKYRLLVEEQLIANRRYKISDSYMPELGNVGIRVTVSIIDETNPNHYEENHGFNYKDGDISSFYTIDDKNGSTHESEFLEDKLGYYEEVMSLFDELINSGKSEFTAKAIKILDNIKTNVNHIGSKKNGI